METEIKEIIALTTHFAMEVGKYNEIINVSVDNLKKLTHHFNYAPFLNNEDANKIRELIDMLINSQKSQYYVREYTENYVKTKNKE